MSSETLPARGLIISGICLPLAFFVGYLLATPDTLSSLFWVATILFLLVLPLLIHRHHELTIICCNLPLIIFFLPGKQTVGVLIAGISLLLSTLSWTFGKKKNLFIHSPATTYPLIFLTLVVFITMVATGGLHSNVFGSQQWGATRYLSIIGAIVTYFAIIARPVPPDQAKLMGSLFFLAGTVWLLSMLFALIPSLNLLLALFPTYVFQSSSVAELGKEVERFLGVSYGMQFLCFYILMRYGIRGLVDWHRPWRALLFLGAFGLGLSGGFRSLIILFFILFLVQFYLEKLFRSPIFLIFLTGGFLTTVFLYSFSDRLPLPIQRSISFMPGINIHPIAQQSAQESLDWRLDIWKAVLPTVPQYLFLGKGFGFDSTDFFFAEKVCALAAARGVPVSPYDNAFLISGDYHSGPLTLIIPLGIWGVLVFAAFCWGAIRALYANYRYGDPVLKQINTFLLAYFVSKVLFYILFFGSFYQDLPYFVSAMGVSITLNGGVRRKDQVASQQTVESQITPNFQDIRALNGSKNVFPVPDK